MNSTTETLEITEDYEVDVQPWKLKLNGNSFEVTGSELFDSGMEAVFHLCEKTKPKQLTAPWARYIAFAGTKELPSVLAVSLNEVTDQQIEDLASQFQNNLMAIIVVLKQRDHCQPDRYNLKCDRKLLLDSVIRVKIETKTDAEGNATGNANGNIHRTNYKLL